VETSVQVPIDEIRRAIFRQFQEQSPRPGVELDAFVKDQCAYHGIEERECRRICGDAEKAVGAMFRQGMQTATQRIADVMALTEADIVETVRETMRAVKKRPVIDKSGRAVLGPDNQPIIIEAPDYTSRLKACDIAAKLVGAYAPKQVQIEARHEHLHTDLTEDELRRQIRELGGAVGITFVDAEYAEVEGEHKRPQLEAPATQTGTSRA